VARGLRAIPLVVDREALEVAGEDGEYLAVNKPAGATTAPAHRWQGGSMVNRVLGHTGREPFGIHRLDQNTSGLLLFAKSSEAARAAHKQFRERTVAKVYLAICVGVPAARTATVDAPIGRHPREQVARMVCPAGKPALTDFEVVARSPGVDLAALGAPGALMDAAAAEHLRGVSLVRCMPHTGRTHQIRVHLAHLGHPILGDEIYGLTGPWIGRQALHAFSLAMQHPREGRRVTFAARLHGDMQAALEQLGLQLPEELAAQAAQGMSWD
jgi:23S rRNA pseudouridine1911/1915/1917 synthase